MSTVVGAEGLAIEDGEFCALATDATGFAERVLALLEDPGEAAAMAWRARAEVVENWDMAVLTSKLAAGYGEMVRKKRAISSGPS